MEPSTRNSRRIDPAWPASFIGKPYGEGDARGIAAEGLPIVAAFFAVLFVVQIILLVIMLTTGARWLLAVEFVVGVLGAALIIWCIWFFRDPSREIDDVAAADAIKAHGAGSVPVVCPADGVIVKVDSAMVPREARSGPGINAALAAQLAKPMPRVGVFMNVFDVHVNRAPIAGVVAAIRYHAGKFFNASFDKASDENERSAMVMTLEDGRAVVVVQVAGLVARRIVGKVAEGQRLSAGERYGLIRFGSRVDVYLPQGSRFSVEKGVRVYAGQSVLGAIPPANPAQTNPPSPPIQISSTSAEAADDAHHESGGAG